MERIGFVGLPNAGKSSLFNALGGQALAAAYPFATVDPNVGIAVVPDDRVEQLAELTGSAKIIHATVEFVDIAGLVEGAHQGEGLGNRFLAHIREVDAITFVLRAFTDDDVIGPTDPLEHLATVETELALADLQSVEGKVERQRKAMKLDKSATLATEVAALDAALATLSEGTPIYRSSMSAEHRAALRPWFLLTNKPVLVVLNLGEDQLADADAVAAPVREAFGVGAEVLPMCVQLEAEAAQLPPEERRELLDAYDLGEGAVTRLIQSAYRLLGRRTYFTTGPDETRAWTFRAGAKAPECAGVIHTDFQKGFIKAECIHWDDLLEVGSWNKAKEVGKLRIEGKDYEVVDGDVLEFRFNV
ncbi:MAG TPA: redox-regulated ATPase YchF [Acidimicrobiales bacterium]|nr:redox-regulated ATPase YchF [Acidimicrobiales bacterium]